MIQWYNDTMVQLFNIKVVMEQFNIIQSPEPRAKYPVPRTKYPEPSTQNQVPSTRYQAPNLTIY